MNDRNRQTFPIPKTIVQTWETYEPPDKWKECIPSIKETMPEWQHKLCNAEDRRNLVLKYFPEFITKFDTYPYKVQQADAWRYLYLYLYGGIYMDLDFVVKKSFNTLFDNLPESDIYVVYSGNTGKVITNSFIACKPKCRIFLDIYKQMLESELPFYAIGRHLTVMNSTGPMLFNHHIKKYRKDPNLGVKVEFIPRERFYVCSVCNPYCSEDGSYVRGLEGGSWITFDTIFFNSWICSWNTWIVGIIMLIFLICLLIFYWRSF